MRRSAALRDIVDIGVYFPFGKLVNHQRPVQKR